MPLGKRLITLLLTLLLLYPALVVRAETDAEVTEGVLACFEQLAAIPRPSHHEEQISAFLLKWAQERGFHAIQDEVGNVYFDVPAAAGRENAPLVALQAHMDMVVVADDPGFDALHTPIHIVRGENTLTADGTSLGADDGIGVATILHLVTSMPEHGPLRVILTVNEEDGMTGMFHMDASVVADVAYLLNLDAETIGEACISTAAVASLNATQQPRRVAPVLDTALRIKVGGLLGGHSGIMIDKGRMNAIQHLADMLVYLRREGIRYELSAFTGGTVPNAIPMAAEALLVMDAEDAPRAEALVSERGKALRSAYSATEIDMTITTEAAELPDTVFEQQQAVDIVNYIALIPDGVHTMSPAIEGLVESSSNLGVARANTEEISVVSYIRSSQAALMEAIRLKQQTLAELCGYETALSAMRTHGRWMWTPSCMPSCGRCIRSRPARS